jgi:hypothetical protein
MDNKDRAMSGGGRGKQVFCTIAPDICPQKGISLLLLKVSLASLQPMQQPTEEK